ncbi:MAG: hypothetical protein JXB34_14175 [Bacteroidales bacterium]|nr:hypothetical protein [Bacteroidales bacterium]
MASSKLNYFLLRSFFIVLFFIGCGERDDFVFPEVYMYATLNVQTDAEYMLLAQPGSSLAITMHPNGNSTIGYNNNGIIVFNNGDDSRPFYAFDRTCPHDLPANYALECDGSMATCPHCGSVYVLPGEGIPSSNSVSRRYLKQYRTSYNINTGTLVISN